MNKVRKTKVKRIANSLKQGKTYTQAMIDEGYSKVTTVRGKGNKVIQEALKQINAELRACDVTADLVIQRLNEDRRLAKKKGDIASMIQADKLLGQFIAIFSQNYNIREMDYSNLYERLSIKDTN